MAQNQATTDMDFETEIKHRIDALIADKRTENEQTIARLTTLDTAWKDVNAELDKDASTELALVRAEADAIAQAKERLARNPCPGVSKKFFGIAGKLVDVETKIGLPGLNVNVALAQDAAGDGVDTQTDGYGNFFAQFPMAVVSKAESKSVVAIFTIFVDAETVLHREERTLHPQPGGIEEVILAVKCTGTLKEALDYGKQVREGVESDAALVEQRALNVDEAYQAFGRLPDTLLLRLRKLKDEISIPPAPLSLVAMVVAPGTGEPQKTRYLGNSSTRELHDLRSVTPQCQIDEIPADRQVSFRTQKEAMAAGYDFCAYCFGKDKSRR